ncbi:acyl-CoA thioesterase [Puniceibacterium sediminis]|uniref:4-hydroxybenzoyl-CoA thioesterase n=1 Tax=Puniceibacterium sediminis TaxID=1608407 RepID=A0A238WXP4_9RHOB|nr:thioesterase family protein [Puniceibacterium sediminis]SNR51297.1 4-hydroxybenzoyl-CoA thioesterase [Puniceibacterium sediminis]
MTFHFTQKVLFKHCDPAGIVFYPRYFEMINDCVEAFFDTALGWPFEEVHKTGAIPTAEISATFRRVSRHGDMLNFALSNSAPGRTSLGLAFAVTCGDELRFEVRSTIVNVDEAGKPLPWPDMIRTKLTTDTGVSR